MPHTQVGIRAVFRQAGSCYERMMMAGISHFIEHMCFKGTRKTPDFARDKRGH